MPSKIDICNMALSLLGEKAIASLSDQTHPARMAALFYDTARDTVLRDGIWNFATKRASLAELADAPTFGFEKAFQLPPDCVRVVSTNLEELEYLYKIEGRTLVTDYTEVNVKYTARILEGNFDPMFVLALAAKLAELLAYPILKDPAGEKTAKERYRLFLAEARGVDAQEGSSDPQRDDTLIKARF